MSVNNVEQKFEELINSLDHGDLLSMVGAYIDEEQLRNFLRNELIDEDKEAAIFSHQHE